MNTFRASRALCRLGAAAVLSLLAVTACSPRQGRAESTPAPVSAADAAGPQFGAPPQPTSAQRLANGTVEIAGQAPPRAVVTLRHPDGQAVSATADAAGAWRLSLPAASEPRLYAVAAVAEGRTLRGEGALLTAPAPAAMGLVLRAGAPAQSLSPSDGLLSLEAMDFDAGGLAVAGRSTPRASLRLSLDGAPAAAGQADAAGRFSLLAVQANLKPGRHRLRLEEGAKALEATVDSTPATPEGGAPYTVSRVSQGWRIDWRIPGGGAQSAQIFSPPVTTR